MTTIQDRIIKDFRDKWTKAPDYHDPNTHQNYPAKYIERMSSLGFFVNMDEVEQFLIQSIKEVEEETKGDVLNKLHAMVCDLVTDKGKDLAKEDCLELIRYQIERIYGKKLLSITNKEK